MTSIGQNIKLARLKKNINQTELSQLCGWSGFPSRISNYERGLREPKSEDLVRLAQSLNVSVDWFYRDYGSEQTMEVRESVATYKAIRYVPLLAWNEAVGYLQGKEINAQDMIPVVNVESNRSFALIVEGDSMESPQGDSFSVGGTIIVDPGLQIKDRDFVIALVNDTATFKQLIIDSGKRFLKPLNLRYPLLEIPRDTEILGVVRNFMRRFR